MIAASWNLTARITLIACLGRSPERWNTRTLSLISGKTRVARSPRCQSFGDNQRQTEQGRSPQRACTCYFISPARPAARSHGRYPAMRASGLALVICVVEHRPSRPRSMCCVSTARSCLKHCWATLRPSAAAHRPHRRFSLPTSAQPIRAGPKDAEARSRYRRRQPVVTG